MEILKVGGLGLLAEGSGLSLGIIMLYLFHIKNKRLMGMLFGGTSGLMLAMICFDVLPEGLDKGRMDLVFVGIIIGALLGLLLDDLVPSIQQRLGARSSDVGKMGLILVLGLAFHNFPEGFALGAMAQASMATISQFAIILALHSIPEGIALAIPFKQGGTRLRFMLLMSTSLGLVMGAGAICGYLLSGINEGLVATGLGVASGLILYIISEELLPESKKIWNGRMTSIAMIVGLMLGIILLAH